MLATQTNTTASTSRLAGQVAIVTGSSRGLGAAIAKQLAAEGAIVAVNYVNGAEAAKAVVDEIERGGGRAHAFQADVAVRAQVFDLVDQVVKRWGRLDVLVNNSGVFTVSPLADVTEDDVDSLLAVNYKGTLWGIQAASTVLTSGGAIINLSSIGARLAAPAAVEVLTKTAAKELGPRGIRVNSVAPGVIETDMADTLPAEFKATAKAQTPLEHRFGTAEEVAHTVAFLASPQASWVTAQNIELAGGF
ncbi:shortchain dehydrogenase/reductase SDR, putative [Acanthamoeba castellanii str. Neff]|uniref:Shortchain dehydrogenase/reductase SDR, putative n=1 Tax=Acanthamoeba castellanii (strain ATCC 30010 / Neff) TaxID=1257118 RepID=L8GZW5_ACACF|nr:shortchain dehydrogenase/reductase SDR, putative [Acanthamoeba castellanii str. Neff]ELR18535.1 shortchain dehydrogenase/reductase SDR, putative [Acanthamoeba castellanii str. Neff]